MRTLITLSLLITSFIASAEVYKTVNPDGSVSYSDVKTENAEAITPPELTPTPAVKLPKKKPVKNANDKDKKQAVAYKKFSIRSPTNNGTVRSNNGNVSVSLTIEPALQTEFKHSITILLDGKPVKTGLASAQAQLTNLDRGEHSVTARLVDNKNEVIKTTSSVTIHMKRHSKLHSKPPGP